MTSGPHTVHLSFQADVHQGQIGARLGCLFNSLLPGRHAGSHRIPQAFQVGSEVLGDDPFIFDDQDLHFGHGAGLFLVGETISSETTRF